jgi:hypothetical protein
MKTMPARVAFQPSTPCANTWIGLAAPPDWPSDARSRRLLNGAAGSGEMQHFRCFHGALLCREPPSWMVARWRPGVALRRHARDRRHAAPHWLGAIITGLGP